jgi:hypothetical protein
MAEVPARALACFHWLGKGLSGQELRAQAEL